MTATVRFQVEARERIRFARIVPAAFGARLRQYLAALPQSPDARIEGILDTLRQSDAAMVAALFDLDNIPEPEIGRYVFHEGDLVLAAMARRVLAQAVVAAKGMRFAADSAAFREAIDSAGLAARVQNFGHYMRETWRLKGDDVRAIVRERLDPSRVKRIVVPGGMGGSAIGVGVARMLLANLGFDAAIELWPHYPDPTRQLRPTDLAAIYAYSGNNEEQLLWMAPAEAAGAQVIGFAVGGRLEQMCREGGHPFVTIPGETFGLAQPREHLPVALVLLLQLIGQLGVARREEDGGKAGAVFDINEWWPRIERTTRRLTELAESSYNVELPLERNVAKRAALFLNWGTTDPERVTNILKTRDPVIWISHLYEPIARRLENQFGECVEHPAPAKLTPEDMHNEQEAYVGQWMETVWRLGDAAGVEAPPHDEVFLRFVTPRAPLERVIGKGGGVHGADRLEARADKLFAALLPGTPQLTFEIQDYGADYPMLGELEALLFCDLTRAFAAVYRGVTPHYVHSMNYNKHYMATVPGTPGSTGTY